MASKTRLTEWVKTFQVDRVAAGLRESAELTGHRDDRGRSWLHLTASVDVAKKRTLDPGDSVRLAGVLLDLGLGIDDAAFTEGTWQATPLWYAVGRGHNLALATFLLERGSTPEHCLWAAAFNEDDAMLALLIEHGAPLEAVAEGETPLLGAVKTSKFKAAETLLRAGANPDYVDGRGMTALHYMLKKGSDKAHFATWVRHGARGDIPGPDGRTAISIMAKKRDPDFRVLAEQLAAARR